MILGVMVIMTIQLHVIVVQLSLFVTHHSSLHGIMLATLITSLVQILRFEHISVFVEKLNGNFA